jgi:hypothetical protein
MGCDIHTRAEKRVDGVWTTIPKLRPFHWRQYGMFGFLADVRNYSAVTPIAPSRGLPDDVILDDDNEYELGEHSFSWLSVQELLDFDYDQKMEDRRVTRQVGGCTAEPGGGRTMTYREFLGPDFFRDLKKLKQAGAERVVFGFDS